MALCCSSGNGSGPTLPRLWLTSARPNIVSLHGSMRMARALFLLAWMVLLMGAPTAGDSWKQRLFSSR